MIRFQRSRRPPALAPIDLHLTDICAHGGHWCRRCQRYVTPERDDVHGQPDRCPRCAGTRLRWDPPVPGFAEREDRQFLTDPKNCHA